MNKHTPGPWKIVGVPYQEFWIVDSASPAHGKQNLIARLQPHWKGNKSGDTKANAHLIAAAPAMLEALERLRGWVVAEAEHFGAVLPDDDIMEQATASIRAAKGEVWRFESEINAVLEAAERGGE